MKAASLLLLTASFLLADGPGRIVSRYLEKDPVLSADPQALHWRHAEPVAASNDPMGKLTPGHRMEVRSLWSKTYLYFLFTCPYEQLHLKPEPSTTQETNKLWDYDVAEVFIGADFDRIRQYKEFQVSPQGEWVDLHIDRDNPAPEGGLLWNAKGFQVKARIDEKNKVWFGEMKIPIASFDQRPSKAGNQMRINMFRIQGPPPDRRFVAWQPTNNRSYHVPEAFGRILLAK
ncbi:MAG: carbohydrate-binding family 9-like protein [Bryobacteraceae bacterium]